MRTTVDIDEDILHAARELATLRKTSLGRVLSDLARESLQPTGDVAGIRNEVPLLTKRSRSGEGMVTLKLVNRLRDESVP